MRKFADIIDRIEIVRKTLKLKKSAFAGQMGLKPQTYNNFVGSQGSKPSVELVYGVVNQYLVNPHWLLNGIGDAFTPLNENMGAGGTRTANEILGGKGEPEFSPRQCVEYIADIKQKLRGIERALEDIEIQIINVGDNKLN